MGEGRGGVAVENRSLCSLKGQGEISVVSFAESSWWGEGRWHWAGTGIPFLPLFKEECDVQEHFVCGAGVVLRASLKPMGSQPQVSEATPPVSVAWREAPASPFLTPSLPLSLAPKQASLLAICGSW